MAMACPPRLWKLEIGNWKPDIGNWKLDNENGKMEIGNWKLEVIQKERVTSGRHWSSNGGLIEYTHFGNALVIL
jgi:hypothetical protein